MPEDSPSLISEVDRDTAVQRLQEAYAEEHISHEEMDERLDQVLTAKTHTELVSALASLPQQNAGTTSTIAAASGRIRRRGVWRVPRILKVESAFGRVHLDPTSTLRAPTAIPPRMTRQSPSFLPPNGKRLNSYATTPPSARSSATSTGAQRSAAAVEPPRSWPSPSDAGRSSEPA